VPVANSHGYPKGDCWVYKDLTNLGLSERPTEGPAFQRARGLVYV
jgi:hypothetical protein